MKPSEVILRVRKSLFSIPFKNDTPNLLTLTLTYQTTPTLFL